MNEPQPPQTDGTDSRASADTVAADRTGREAVLERTAFERLMFATLEEQRRARRWRSFVRLAWLAFFIFLVWTLVYRGAPSTDVTTPHTAVVELKGEIASEADASAENVVAAMRSAFGYVSV
jgi:protease-4